MDMPPKELNIHFLAILDHILFLKRGKNSRK
jgi:hypothetical protein